MPATHTLDTKIEALNLLNLHDGDLKLVYSRLGIPIRTMRGWLLDEKQLRLQYYDRQYHHFGNIKFELLNRFLVYSLDTMEKLMTGDLGGQNPSCSRCRRAVSAVSVYATYAPSVAKKPLCTNGGGTPLPRIHTVSIH